MTASDLAALVVTGVAVAALVVLALAIQSLLRTLRSLRATLEQLEAETGPLLEELRSTVRAAGAEVERVDHLLEAAESISATVEGASRVSYLAFRAPLIRLVAFWRGVGRFLRRLVGRDGGTRRRARRAGRRATSLDPDRRAA